jgi:pilus assembly protein CpaE
LSAANVMPINLGASSVGSTAPLVAFLGDEGTRGTLVTALGSDWPAATINAGGINEAVVHLAADPSARVLIVDFGQSPDMFKALDRLAEVCTPGTLVIALGEVNDVTLYRRLRAAGVADYLVKPVTAEAFGHALHLASQPTVTIGHDKATRPKGDVIAVVGARGGVGATMVATTLAWLFAEEANRRTMLIDLDVRWGTTGLALDVETSHGLCEVLANPERIDSLFVSSAAARIGDKLSLLASEEPLDTGVEARPGSLELLLKEARRDSERIVLDVPRLGGDLLRRALSEASVVVIVTDFSLAGLRDAGRLVSLTKEISPSAHCHVVGNRAGASKKSELPRAEVQKALKTTLAAVIPEDHTAVLQALNTGKALPQAAPGCKAVVALRALAKSFDKEVAEDVGLFARFFSRGASKAARRRGKNSPAAAD